MTGPVPLPDVDTAGFWDAARSGWLAVARCTECRFWQHPPTERCRRCGGPFEFEPVSGDARVFSFIVVRHATVPGHEIPYVVGLVELHEQPGLRMSAVIDAPPERVTVGMPVRAQMRRVGESDEWAPEFVPID